MTARKKKSTSKYASIRKWTGNENYGLPQFRRDIRKLVKSGILADTVNADAQAVTDYMLRQIKVFHDVIVGEAQVIQIGKAEIPFYKAEGYRVKRRRLVVRARPTEKVVHLPPTERGIPRFAIRAPGYNKRTKVNERVMFPYLGLKERITNYVYSEREPKPDEILGFRFKGFRSARLFPSDETKSSRERLLEYFLAYDVVLWGESHREDEDEIYSNFEIVYFENTPAAEIRWNDAIREQRQRAKKEHVEANRERLNARRRQRYAEMDELEKRAYNERHRESKSMHAERERERRARLKRENPEVYQDQMEAARVRRDAWRAKKKAEKK